MTADSIFNLPESIIFTIGGCLNFDSDKIVIRLITLDALPLLGAAELTFRGWHAEAIPHAQKKKSLFELNENYINKVKK